MDNAIDLRTTYPLIAINSVDSAIQLLNNRGQEFHQPRSQGSLLPASRSEREREGRREPWERGWSSTNETCKNVWPSRISGVDLFPWRAFLKTLINFKRKKFETLTKSRSMLAYFPQKPQGSLKNRMRKKKHFRPKNCLCEF